MNTRTRSAFLFAAPLLIASAALGQAGSGGTINAGNAVFRQQDAPTGAAGPTGLAFTTGMDLRTTGAAGPDHGYQSWWWYRLAGDTREYALANADVTQSVWAGDLGKTHFELPLFMAHCEYKLMQPGTDQASVLTTLEITNTGTAPVSITIFHYLDCDLQPNLGNDSAALTTNPSIMRITDPAGPYAEYGAKDAAAYSVTPFATLRTQLTDTVVTTLTSTGLPFGPADWTGGWEWAQVTLAPGGIKTYTVVHTINTPAVFPVTCYPDCNADGNLNLGDFGCFQTKFALGDPYADCNGDGALNLGDFGCFQTKFALGCP